MGKFIGLDLGSKTCGVAISDGLGFYAHPLATLYYVDEDLDLLRKPLEEIVQREKVLAIALGLPKHMNNDLSLSAVRSENFKEKLMKWFDLDVALIDERLTSVKANRQLIDQNVSRKKRKQVVDQVAAMEILQTYLDQRRFKEVHNG